MSRAEGLSVAWDLLSRATDALGRTARLLRTCDLDAWADQAEQLREQTTDLRTRVANETDAAHRAANPDAYDGSGRWIGKGQ